MGFAVAIICSQFPRAVVIRKDWIYRFSTSKTMNHGANRNQWYSIFYSANIETAADFTLPFDQEFEEHVNACYHAKLYRFFGKLNFYNESLHTFMLTM